ncbi:helix-turn-helix transcriptional regulator [Luteimicrobium subarcticum]|uniref:Proteasome accessory factor B n=1 Tax=Luteimicrobium subarcticum TaxID=620910 RepID=A0A2M8W3Q3_9MICO|nr:WYL domain-containing protein [Luteimicrobium subarcticum]PJI85557.1 proteasome accessory factor B [Luteimicrobium subarcticum]
MPSQTPPAERLLNLVIALVNTPTSMSKQQVRSGVSGYGDAPSADAFERMFERDKDTLRDLGVPVVTVDAGGHSDDVGYRIDLDAYTLEPLDLTPAELGVLALAAQFWQDKALRVDTARALTKIRAAGRGSPGSGEAGTDAVAGLSPRVRAAGRAFVPLLDAIQGRRVVRFTYRAANTGEVREREVEPWRLAARRGGWYLIGRDRDRGAPRSYRLSRVEGTVRVTGTPGAFVPPEHVDVDAALSGRSGEVREARLAVVPERAGAVRARAVSPRGTDLDGRRDLVVVPFTSRAALADELAGYGDVVVVLGPPDLRAAVVARLQEAAALDGGAAAGSDATEGTDG